MSNALVSNGGVRRKKNRSVVKKSLYRGKAVRSLKGGKFVHFYKEAAEGKKNVVCSGASSVRKYRFSFHWLRSYMTSDFHQSERSNCIVVKATASEQREAQHWTRRNGRRELQSTER